MPPAPRLLIVEDEALIALDMETQLTRLGYTVLALVDTGLEAIRQATALRPDLMLMDIRLKGAMDGIETAAALHAAGLEIPVLFLTAYADDATLQRAGLTAPFGYLVKPFDARALRATIEMALYRHQAERRQRGMEHWLATTLQSLADGVLATDTQGRITLLNPMAERITGWTRREALDRPLAEVLHLVHADSRAPLPDLVSQTLAYGVGFTPDAHTRLLTRDGHLRPIEYSAAPIRAEDGQGTGVVVLCRDRSTPQHLETARHQMEEQLRSAQKFESLGVLAEGLSQQFNNLLNAILGYAELCSLEIPAEASVHPYLQRITSTAQQAADLCAQMRAYAGQGQGVTYPFALPRLVQDTVRTLQPVLGAQVAWKLDLEVSVPLVCGDPGQMQQVIVNLLRNAAEALPDHAGTIRLRTGTRLLTASDLAATVTAPALPAGPYVCLEVADTGSGMPPELLGQIFDPFFSTKLLGRGLGLAAVLGIVRQHQGALQVESTPGQGSTFRVLLPAAESATADAPDVPQLPPGERAFIL